MITKGVPDSSATGSADAIPPFNCWSVDDGDHWFGHPADSEIIESVFLDGPPKIGDEYTVKAGWRSVEVKYRVTSVDADGDVEAECITHPKRSTPPAASGSAQVIGRVHRNDGYATGALNSIGRQLPDGTAIYAGAPPSQQADPSAERTPLQQYDREQQPGYRDGWKDGRLYGYEVGKRHAAEPASVSAKDAAVQVPDFLRVAKYKLDELLNGGFKITGYSIENDQSPNKIGFITYGGFVGWWSPDSVGSKIAALPLTDDQLNAEAPAGITMHSFKAGARFAEQHHGITPAATKDAA